jgi:hypothetical protein
MLGLPSGLRRMLLPTYLFLAACSIAALVAAEALAPGWDLGLAALRLPKAGLQQQALLQLGLQMY